MVCVTTGNCSNEDGKSRRGEAPGVYDHPLAIRNSCVCQESALAMLRDEVASPVSHRPLYGCMPPQARALTAVGAV